ncbi:MAG TPA: kelch repeat-containing protein, partial [Polyangia bacterium]
MRARILVALAAVAAVGAAGCKEKPRTEIIVGIATDLTAPAPLRKVHLEVTRLPTVSQIGEQDFPITDTINDVFELPGTYALYSETGAPDRVRVVLNATDDQGRLLVQRSAVMSLVPEKTLFVRLGVVSACVGKLDCPAGDTCIDGRCAPETIDSTRLPVYTPGMEKEVSCSGGTTYVGTVTHMPLTMKGTACADKGICQEGVCLGAVEGSFTATKGAPLAARSAAVQIGARLMVLDDGKILSVGGTGPTGSGRPVLATAETYDPASGQFTAAGSLAVPRAYFGEAKLRDGRVLIAGGINDGGAALGSAELYDPATRTFSPTAGPMGTARVFPSMARLADGRVLVVGGIGQGAITSYAAGQVNFNSSLASAEIYDPATGTFTPVEGSLMTGRAFPHVTALPDGGALVLGGGYPGQNTLVGATTLERFDVVRGTFGAARPAAFPDGTTFVDSNVAELADGRLLVTTTPGDQAWLIDPAAGTLVSGGSHPAPRGTLAAVLVDGRVLIAGGI